MLKITIDNEEVLCDKDFTINEEMLNTSSVILNNVYPKSWEQDKDYVSRFYYPKDYSKCKIFEETYHPEEEGSIVENTTMSIDYDDTKNFEYYIKGQTTQSGTPTPSSPQPINVVSGRQEIDVMGKNVLPVNIENGTTIRGLTFNRLEDGTLSISGTSTGSIYELHTGGDVVLPKGTYTGSFGDRTNITGCYIRKDNGAYQTIFENRNTNTFTINSDFTYNRVYMYIPTNKTFNNQIIKPQLEKGTQATPYEAYNETDYEINLGKNLLDLSTITSGSNYGLTWNNDNGTITIDGLATDNYIIQSHSSSTGILLQAGTYTFSANNSQTVLTDSYMYLIKTSGSTTITNTTLYLYNANAKSTFTLTEDTLVRVRIRTELGTNYEDFEIKPQLERGDTSTSYSPYKTPIELCKIGDYQDRIFKNTIDSPFYDSNLELDNWYLHKEIAKINSYNGETITSTYLSTTGELSTGATIYYQLATSTDTLIEDSELINQLNNFELLNGTNNITINGVLPFIMNLHYNYYPSYISTELYFCGIVKNTGDISLNPRYPHYCNVQVLDFKDFLSQGETLDFVITNKTIGEAIEQVIGTIASYGFTKGNINLSSIDDVMGTYSTKDKTAYDVFNYIANITQSRWKTRMIDEDTIAIDFYDPNQLPQGTGIEYTQTWFENNKINDMTYSYSSNDYRNKQIMLSSEVYSNVETTEIITADGYQTQFNTIGKIGYVSSILLNGNPMTIITKDEENLGYEGDFVFQPGEMKFESTNLVSTGAIITITYYAIIEGREIVLNQDEITRLETNLNRKGIVARYETRNDSTTTSELQAIGQSYLQYKGTPEIKLNISSRSNIWDIGERVYFNAPLDELKQEYMVKKKTIQRITTIDELFYEFELTSSFNMEQDINYFDNQRYKSYGNIGQGETISRNIDIENTANIIFYDFDYNETTITGTSELQSDLQAPLGVE